MPAPTRTGRVAPGLVAGIVASAGIGVTFYVSPGVETGAKGLAMVVPVVVGSLIGGRRSAYPIAALATFGYSLLIPPEGTPRIHHFGDFVALVVFVFVACITVELVAHRVDAMAHVDRHRSALLRSVSHDLRTPLSSIKAATTELLSDHPHDEPTERRLLHLVNVEADRLDRLVANLLDMSRIDAGALHAKPQSVDLVELLHSCRDRVAPLFNKVRVVVDVPPTLSAISADYVLLDQLVTNLLDNAARHTPPGSTVEVRVVESEHAVTLLVSDQGEGVPPERAQTIFEPFTTTRVGGSGIGLTICRAIVEAHAGTITVREARGGGAEFVVILPRE